MALNDVVFVKGQGGLGRALAGADYISGWAVYSASLPAGFSSAVRVKPLLSVSDAEALGIDTLYTDETQAAGTYLITTKGNTGDTIEFKVAEPIINADGTSGTNVVSLGGAYTVPAGSSTIAAQGADIAALINASTYLHGYTASFTTATLTITAKKGMGVSLNSGTPIAVTITGAFAGTITQFTGGTASSRAVWHYHIAEYFRLNPQGKLWFGIFAVPGTYTFTELITIQKAAGGEVRKFAVYKEAVTSASQFNTDITALKAARTTLDTLHMPVTILYAANIAAITDLSTLVNQNNNTGDGVSAVIAQDGGFKGAGLYLAMGKSITSLGATLGAVSLASVHEDIAWAEKFNATDGYENAVPAFANGQLLSALSDNLVSQLNSYRYIFLIKVIGQTGTYWNDNHCCVSISSDYAYLDDTEVINKVQRLIYGAIRPKLNSPLILNADGTLTNVSIETFVQAGKDVVKENMVTGKTTPELSAFDMTIDPKQNVNATSKMIVAAEIVKDGVARNIQVNIGYVGSL